MGIAQAGIAFKPNQPVDDVCRLVSALYGGEASPIEHPNVGQFDIRNHSDVMVQFFGDSCFICNDNLAWNALENPQTDVTKIYHLLGCPDLFVIFCHYGSGGSYGYAFVEKGQITRSRFQTTDYPPLPPVVEFGVPKNIESRWLSADFFLDEDDCPEDEWQKVYYLGDVTVSEDELTGYLLQEILNHEFGVCPWDTDMEPIYHFFKFAGKNGCEPV